MGNMIICPCFPFLICFFLILVVQFSVMKNKPPYPQYEWSKGHRDYLVRELLGAHQRLFDLCQQPCSLEAVSVLLAKIKEIKISLYIIGEAGLVAWITDYVSELIPAILGEKTALTKPKQVAPDIHDEA